LGNTVIDFMIQGFMGTMILTQSNSLYLAASGHLFQSNSP